MAAATPTVPRPGVAPGPAPGAGSGAAGPDDVTAMLEQAAAAHVALAEAVEVLVRLPLDALWPHQLQEQITALAPQLRRLEGVLALAAGQLHRCGGGQVTTEQGGSRPAVGWLAETTRSSSRTAAAVTRTAVQLQTDLPLIAQALLDGELTVAHGRVLTRLIGRIDPAALTESQPALLTLAELLDPDGLAAQVRRLIAQHCEPALDAEAAGASARRYWQSRLAADGTLRGHFVLAAEDAEAVLTVLEPLARRQGAADERSAGQRRADALVEVFNQAARHDQLPDAGGHRPQLSYVLPADWAARQADRAVCPTCSACPAHRPDSFLDTVLAGLPPHQPARHPGGSGRSPDGACSRGAPAAERAALGRAGTVPAGHGCAVAAWTGPQTRTRIETLLCDARISRVLLDEAGQVAGLQHVNDQITRNLRIALAARDLGCAARGCTRPPAMCDAHHLLARADGGPTTLHNLVLLCRRHHLLWHLGKLLLSDLHVPWLTAPDPDPPPS